MRRERVMLLVIALSFHKTAAEVLQFNHLLDLKQKQANASEARTARLQAKQADRQGKARQNSQLKRPEV